LKSFHNYDVNLYTINYPKIEPIIQSEFKRNSSFFHLVLYIAELKKAVPDGNENLKHQV